MDVICCASQSMSPRSPSVDMRTKSDAKKISVLHSTFASNSSKSLMPAKSTWIIAPVTEIQARERSIAEERKKRVMTHPRTIP